MQQQNHEQEVFHVADIAPRPTARSWKIMLPAWALLIGLGWLGLHYGLDAKLVAGGMVLFGLVSSAFAWLLGVIGLVPIAGPLILKILAIPFIWLLNAIGYLVSFIAIRRGYSKDVLTYRGLTIALLVGIVIGYILGKLI
ncbi:uncharacterized protein NMK_0048 [Novimethylophilus kurashikiensis]|uniref:Uncharacterized protein n=1 Tax=Novimethylophilus kurashikiensis TaxID=1825523 RepID=A0A2R5F196_9PROT|nr:hypothetical protein [Novimethylophilus kurashikiensis]GBG12517.1 uncharacterized protein NMK_0048 [Novimethylophilus kurashikiensis]